MIITFEEFISKYNIIYKTNIKCLSTNTHDIYSIIDKLYNVDYFEIDNENKTIELF